MQVAWGGDWGRWVYRAVVSSAGEASVVCVRRGWGAGWARVQALPVKLQRRVCPNTCRSCARTRSLAGAPHCALSARLCTPPALPCACLPEPGNGLAPYLADGVQRMPFVLIIIFPSPVLQSRKFEMDRLKQLPQTTQRANDGAGTQTQLWLVLDTGALQASFAWSGGQVTS